VTLGLTARFTLFLYGSKRNSVFVDPTFSLVRIPLQNVRGGGGVTGGLFKQKYSYYILVGPVLPRGLTNSIHETLKIA
jgi:hypothetical protein